MALMSYFGTLFQTSYVAKDRDRAVEHAATKLGIDNFTLFDSTAPVLAGGRVQELSLRVAVANAGRHQFEIIQPVSGPTHVYTDGIDLDARPMTFHHIALAVTGPYANWEQLLAEVQASGDDIAFQYYAEPGSQPTVRFMYVDTRPSLGHHTEYLWWAPAMNGNPAFPNLD